MTKMSRSKISAVSVAAGVCLVVALLWIPAILVYWNSGRNAFGTDNTQPILVSMQKLGDLHTARVSLKQEVDQNTYKEARGWMRAVPGVNWLVESATRNQAIVIADASVEAGVNLAQLTASDVNSSVINGVKTITVHLPPVQIYRPNVTLHVVSQSGSFFYNDENIVPQAQAHAMALFRSEAEQMHLRQIARTQAIKQLMGLTSKFGVKNVNFVF